jgi:hypothetical protein
VSLLGWFSRFSAFWPCVTTRLNDRNEAANGSLGGQRRRSHDTAIQISILLQRTAHIIIPIHSRKPDRAHSALHHHRCPQITIGSLCMVSAPLPRCTRRSAHHDAPTRPSHAHQALLISPLTRAHPTVLIVDKHPEDVRLSPDSLDLWQYSSSSNFVTYKSECHIHYISRSMSFFGHRNWHKDKGQLTWRGVRMMALLEA